MKTTKWTITTLDNKKFVNPNTTSVTDNPVFYNTRAEARNALRDMVGEAGNIFRDRVARVTMTVEATR